MASNAVELLTSPALVHWSGESKVGAAREKCPECGGPAIRQHPLRVWNVEIEHWTELIQVQCNHITRRRDENGAWREKRCKKLSTISERVVEGDPPGCSRPRRRT